MKKLLLGCMFVCVAAVTQGRPVPQADAGWPVALEERIVQAQPKELKAYYPNQEISDLCEKWPRCKTWAAQQYEKDDHFLIQEAFIKLVFSSAWHNAGYKPRLYVRAVRKGKTVLLECPDKKTCRELRRGRHLFPKNESSGK